MALPRRRSAHPALPRSWLGVGGPTPSLNLHITHTSRKKHIMRKRSIFTIPAAAAGVIALGLTIGAALPTYNEPGVAAPTPTSSFTLPPVLAAAVQCEEDEPCWDCEVHGNLICGGTELTEAQKSDAWALWESAGGAAELLVNPHAKVTVTGYTREDPYERKSLGVQQLALFGGDIWYIFTAEAI